jgi:3-methyl-2-oxobutanoate hydroxymethyltransferase
MEKRSKVTILTLQAMKERGEKISWLTSYDYPTAQFAEAARVDMLLVGDSLGMCVYGYESTVPVTMDQCIVHSEAVRRAAPTAFVMGDMPFMSYQKSDENAVANAGRFLKEAGVDAVKLLIEDALAIEQAGAQLLLLEAVPPEVAGFITDKLSIPVFGIGAGADCDGQLLIVSDLIGQFQAFTPKFVKQYANIAEVITGAMCEYVKDIKAGTFPASEHCYHMLKGEEEKFKQLAKKYE